MQSAKRLWAQLRPSPRRFCGNGLILIFQVAHAGSLQLCQTRWTATLPVANSLGSFLFVTGRIATFKTACFVGSDPGGWWGPASKHYRGKRDSARGWLADESDPRVQKWLRRYIESLTYQIERAEIEEERQL